MALIGCRHDLDTLDADDLERVRQAVAGYLERTGLHLLAYYKNRDLQQQLIDGINSALEGEPVTDVILYNLSLTEFE